MVDDGSDFRDKLEENRVEIIKCLDIQRQFLLSHLRSKFVLDDEDCEIINGAGPSRQQKVSKFIDVLSTKGPNGYQHFVDALEYEHGYLYELFTGKKPSSPVLQRRFNNALNGNQNAPYSILSSLQLIDSEREYLANELEKSTGATQTMAFLQNKLTKEKAEIEKQYFAAQQELTEKEIIIEELKNDISVRDEIIANKANSDEIQSYVMQTQHLLKENNEQSQIIIALQAQLLVCKDRIEENNQTVTQLKRKNENLMQQVKDLTIDYDWQRQTSTRLSRQVDQNQNDLRKFSLTNKEIYELKFQLARVVEERDDAQKQLRESQTSLEELSAHNEFIQKEINEETEKRGQFSQEYLQMKEKVNELRHKLFLEATTNDKLRRRNNRMTKEIETYKEQREFLLNERENMIRDIDQTSATLRETEKFNQQLQTARDDSVRKQIEISTMFEKQLMELEAELENTQNELDSLKLSRVEDQENSDNVPASPLTKVFGTSAQRATPATRFSTLAVSSQAMLRVFRTLNRTQSSSKSHPSSELLSSFPIKPNPPPKPVSGTLEKEPITDTNIYSPDMKFETRRKLSRQPAVRNTEKKKNPKYVTAFESNSSGDEKPTPFHTQIDSQRPQTDNKLHSQRPQADNKLELRRPKINTQRSQLDSRLESLRPRNKSSRFKNSLLEMNRIGLSISAPSLTSEV